MTFEWSDNGVKRVTALSKAVRDAMLEGVRRNSLKVTPVAGSSIQDDDDVFSLFLQKQKIGAELHIYPTFCL